MELCRALFLVLCGMLAGCGTVKLEHKSPAFFTADADPKVLTVNVARVNHWAHSIRAEAVVNGSRHAMQGSEFGDWTYAHSPSGAGGISVYYDIGYSDSSLDFLNLFGWTWVQAPGGSKRLPAQGAFQIPVFAALSDIDNDGIIDRYDNCPFHANATLADIDSNGVGDACDSSAARRSMQMEMRGGVFVAETRSTVGGNEMYRTGAGVTYYAFQFLDSAVAKVAAVSGFDSLTGIDLASEDVRLEIRDCVLRYQDPDGGYAHSLAGTRFVQVFTTGSGSDCRFELDRNGTAIARGEDTIIMVITDFSYPLRNDQFGQAKLFGRTTMPVQESLVQIGGLYGLESVDDPVRDDLTGSSAPGYVYFTMPLFSPLQSGQTGGSPTETGNFTGDGFIAVQAP